MAFSFATAQVIAVLFTAGGTIHIAAEDASAPNHFYVGNSDAGATEMATKLMPLRDMAKEPFFCIGVAPGAKLEGTMAEELTTAPIRRFILAQAMYQVFARAEGLDTSDAQTLLRACRKQFPR